jgi:hypothetical protein
VQKSVRAECSRDVAVQNLDGDTAFVTPVTRLIYGRHATAADFTLDGVMVAKSGDWRD